MREARASVLGAAVLGLLAATATVVQAIVLGEVVSRMLLDGTTREWLASRLFALLGAVLARALFVWARELVASRGAAHAGRRIRERLVEHLFALGPARLPDAGTGGVVTTAGAGVERLDGYFARYLPQVYLGALVPVLIAGCVLYLDPMSGAVLLVTGPGYPS